MKKRIAIVFAMMFSVYCVAFAGKSAGVFTVEADAIVKTAPDRVVFNVGVISRSVDLMDAKKKNFDAIKKAIEYCKKAGIPEKNIKTDYINIRPEWKNYDKLESTYVVEQDLSIILDEVSKYEEVITELLKAGMNKVGYINFQTTKLKEYKNESRKLAIQAAKERAEFLAREAGIKLGRIVNISDVSTSWFPFGGSGSFSGANIISQRMVQNGGQSEDLAEAAAPGMVSVRSQIVLTYEIK